MGLNANLLAETILKLVVFMPVMGVVAWWLFSAWFVEKALHFEEFAVGAGLWVIAFLVGVSSILRGGWGSFTVLGFVYLALLALAAWEYVYWRRKEMEHLRREVARYQRALETDPTAVAAYSLLGQTYLKLRQFEAAEAALEKAVEMDPEGRAERSLLRRARAREGVPRRWWADRGREGAAGSYVSGAGRRERRNGRESRFESDGHGNGRGVEESKRPRPLTPGPLSKQRGEGGTATANGVAPRTLRLGSGLPHAAPPLGFACGVGYAGRVFPHPSLRCGVGYPGGGWVPRGRGRGGGLEIRPTGTAPSPSNVERGSGGEENGGDRGSAVGHW